MLVTGTVKFVACASAACDNSFEWEQGMDQQFSCSIIEAKGLCVLEIFHTRFFLGILIDTWSVDSMKEPSFFKFGFRANYAIENNEQIVVFYINQLTREITQLAP